MQTQYNDLLGALAFVVVGVEQGKDIRKELTTLGAKHHGYGVEAKYYMMVGASLIKTLHEYLADVWTPEVETSWKDAYEVVSSIMMAAPTGLGNGKKGTKMYPSF